ncbi:T9SS type A sorting domain-containing protein [Mucilaginibacter sp. McL0603]|uniref:T9SS type A sorting domain-containing protein n=1 Tax=Mucilaginibacter sp. McL0603 TaxID=3415670 RepID=UPI003CFA301E
MQRLYSAMLPYTIYPNPAQSTVNIIATDNTSSQTADVLQTNSVTQSQPRVFDAYILNDKGVKLRISKNNKQTVGFDIRDLPNGLYFVHIYENGKIIKKELSISR